MIPDSPKVSKCQGCDIWKLKKKEATQRKSKNYKLFRNYLLHQRNNFDVIKKEIEELFEGIEGTKKNIK